MDITPNSLQKSRQNQNKICIFNHKNKGTQRISTRSKRTNLKDWQHWAKKQEKTNR